MGTEVTKVYTGAVEFNSWARDHTVLMYSDDPTQLLDVALSFYSLPSTHPLTPSQALIGGEDFRVYANNLDVTTAVLAELQDMVKAADKSRLRSEYLQGARSYIRYLQALGTHVQQTAGDQAFAETLAMTSDWPVHFSRLGDRTYGWSGNLHPFSFLYRTIQIPPILLSKVWVRYRSANPMPLPQTLAELPLRSISFSCGPAPSFEHFDPSTFNPGGVLVYALEAAYVNPLEEPLQDILRQLDQLARGLETVRTEYLEVALTSIEQIERDLKALQSSTVTRLEQLTQAVEHIAP
ncbi:MAG: hypothetical protein ACK47B_06880 [Armatimonadota bacterium]